MSFTLKHQLTGKSLVNKQQINPVFVSRALEKLSEINLFYKNVTVNNKWEDISIQSDTDLWKLLTYVTAREPDIDDQSDRIGMVKQESNFFFFFASEPYWEELAFLKDHYTGRNHLNEE